MPIRTTSSPSRSRLPARVRRLLAPLALLLLAACGGGGGGGGTSPGGSPAPGDGLPSALTATEVAQRLTSPDQAYPGALAVRVTSTALDVQVRGVRRLGGAALAGDEAFPMGSLTKSMTATLAAVLVQEGRIAWSARVLDVLPELAATARADYAAVTLADLLAHRGGVFPADTAEQLAQLPAVDGSPGEQRLQLAGWLLRRAPGAAPRAATLYSNGGYVLAGAMLERVAGQPYEALLQAKVFTPLGAAVAFGAPGEAAGEPWGHAFTAAGWQAVDPAEAQAAFPAFGNPAGGAKLNGAALARYLQMHLRAWRGAATPVLAPATAQVLHTLVDTDFALGWQAGQDLAGRAIQWHNGSDDASYYALAALGRDADTAAALVVSAFRPSTEQHASQALVRLLR